MRIDAYTHFIPKDFLDQATKIAGEQKDIGKRMRELPAIYDLDVRRRIVESFPDYAQILCYPMPTPESFIPRDKLDDLIRICNDGFAEICRKHPEQFPGFVAQISLASPDAGVREAERAIKELGAIGVQIYTNVGGKPIDRPEYEPFFAAMNELGAPIWMHPTRHARHPDYMDEKKSLYEIWWTFGWSYETAAAMARLVFSKTLDKYSNLKIVVHHFGGIVPMLEGRIGPGWDQLGTRTSDEDYVTLLHSLKKRPLDYFKQNFYPDTATFGSRGAFMCGLEFFPREHVIFASDCPFDPEMGPGYIRDTIAIVDTFDLPAGDRDRIYYKNLERLTGKTFVK
jgi:aminocarboxymuconate-semialdehyde decarboxylase